MVRLFVKILYLEIQLSRPCKNSNLAKSPKSFLTIVNWLNPPSTKQALFSEICYDKLKILQNHFLKYASKFINNVHTGTQILSGDNYIKKAQFIAESCADHFPPTFNTFFPVNFPSFPKVTLSAFTYVPTISDVDVTRCFNNDMGLNTRKTKTIPFAKMTNSIHSNNRISDGLILRTHCTNHPGVMLETHVSSGTKASGVHSFHKK
jgi:hypothetical protein